MGREESINGVASGVYKVSGYICVLLAPDMPTWHLYKVVDMHINTIYIYNLYIIYIKYGHTIDSRVD